MLQSGQTSTAMSCAQARCMHSPYARHRNCVPQCFPPPSPTDMGHSGPGALPHYDDHVLPWCPGWDHCVWHHQAVLLWAPPQLAGDTEEGGVWESWLPGAMHCHREQAGHWRTQGGRHMRLCVCACVHACMHFCYCQMLHDWTSPLFSCDDIRTCK